MRCGCWESTSTQPLWSETMPEPSPDVDVAELQVVVVTGAGQGIGRSIAERLAADNWYAVAVDINRDHVTALAEELGERCEAQIVDVGDRHAVLRMFDDLGRRLGRVDAVVNNAMVLRSAFIADM